MSKEFPDYITKVKNTVWNRARHLSTAKIWIDNYRNMIDYVITDSKWCDEMYPKGLVYNGEFLRIGAPRCDILYGDKSCWREKIRKEYHLPLGAKKEAADVKGRMPFLIAEDNDELERNILGFDQKEYEERMSIRNIRIWQKSCNR